MPLDLNGYRIEWVGDGWVVTTPTGAKSRTFRSIRTAELWIVSDESGAYEDALDRGEAD